MLRNWWAGVAVGVAAGLAALAGVNAATGEAQGQSGFTVSPGQLQINQKISQASVRRSNRALNYLAPVRTQASDADDDGTDGVKPPVGTGWTGAQIADGAIGRADLAQEVQRTLPMWITKTGNGPDTVHRSSSPGIALVRIGAGVYRAEFPSDLSGCSWNATLGTDGAPAAGARVRAFLAPVDPRFIIVRTSNVDDSLFVESGFTLHVVC
jgi:hypothetical protein